MAVVTVKIACLRNRSFSNLISVWALNLSPAVLSALSNTRVFHSECLLHPAPFLTSHSHPSVSEQEHHQLAKRLHCPHTCHFFLYDFFSSVFFRKTIQEAPVMEPFNLKNLLLAPTGLVLLEMDWERRQNQASDVNADLSVESALRGWRGGGFGVEQRGLRLSDGRAIVFLVPEWRLTSKWCSDMWC